MEITVKVEAEGLEKAINVLAQAISNQSIGEVAATQEQPEQEAPPIAPVKLKVPKQEVPKQEVPKQEVPKQAVAPVKQEAPAQAVPAVPTSNPGFTMDQLAVAATQLMDAGKRDDIISLLSTFNVQALTGLPKDQYGAFATSLRGMGAKL